MEIVGRLALSSAPEIEMLGPDTEMLGPETEILGVISPPSSTLEMAIWGPSAGGASSEGSEMIGNAGLETEAGAGAGALREDKGSSPGSKILGTPCAGAAEVGGRLMLGTAATTGALARLGLAGPGERAPREGGRAGGSAKTSIEGPAPGNGTPCGAITC